MNYDFDTVYDRAATDSLKWANLTERCGSKDAIPLWVADMDFACPPEVVRAVRDRAAHPIYGYPVRSDSYYRAVCGWMEKRHGWKISPEWLVYVPGVVPALNFAVQAFTRPGDGIVIQPPVYYPFRKSIRENGRRIIENPLLRRQDRYEMDLSGLEKAIDSRTRLLILCSPHNPVGRVWTQKELEALADFCISRDILIVSDEIHFDLVLGGQDGRRHTCLASLSQEIADRTVTLTAPNKTFNIAGLTMGNAVISNPRLREEFEAAVMSSGIEVSNVFGNVAAEAAYREGEAWLDQLLQYIEANYRLVADFIASRIPEIRVLPLEGTYLAWLDCAGLGMDDGELKRFFFQDAKLWLDDGPKFGTGGAGFMRMNLAAPKSLIEESLKRLEGAVAPRRRG
jgi:cystathionine beta-lyase